MKPFSLVSSQLRTIAVAVSVQGILLLGACGGSVPIGNQAVDGGAGATGFSGGATAGGGGQAFSGGALASGGNQALGGVPGSGGRAASGGATGAGGFASGGASNAGGAPGTGGALGSGGVASVGGARGSGGVLGSGGVPGSGGSNGRDAGADAATACPATIPTGQSCTGALNCSYGSQPCCGFTTPAMTCVCGNGTFFCSIGECNMICPDAGAVSDAAVDSALDSGHLAQDAGGACTASGPSCGAGLYCAWQDKRCGARAQGTCAATTACNANSGTVCGCDGNNYASECEAARAGVDVSSTATCTPPAGTFRCGWSYCQHGTQYCSAEVGGAVDSPGVYTCVALPAACSTTPSCACVSGTAATCSQSAAGDVTLTIPVP